MSLLELRRSRFPAWLAILALLAIFLAPPISQFLRAHHHVQAQPCPSNDVTLSLPDSVNTLSGHGQHPHHHTLPMPSSASMMGHDHMGEMGMDHAACGYCVLFTYLPVLVISGALHLAATRWRQHGRESRHHQAHFYHVWSLFPQPRAPPRLAHSLSRHD